MRLSRYTFSLMRKYRSRYLAIILGFSIALGTVFSTNGLFVLFDGMVDRFFMLNSSSLMVVSKGSNLIQIVPFTSRVSENIQSDIELIPGVQAVIPLHFKDFSNSSTTAYSREVIVGIDLAVLENFFLKSIPLTQGTWPKPGMNEIVIGPEISGGNLKINDHITIRNESFTVVGITEADNPMFDHFIYVEYDKISEIYNVQGFCNMMYVVVDSTFIEDLEQRNTIKTQIAQVSDQILVMDSDDVRNTAGDFFEVLDIFQLVLGMFPLIMSIVFIYVILMLNIKDQRREFAILRAIGIPSWKIGITVFIPTFIIALVGYVLGIGVGYLMFSYSYFNFLEYTADFTGPFDFAEYMSRKIDPSVYQDTFLGTIIMGFLVGLIPSINSARGNIIEHLRREE